MRRTVKSSESSKTVAKKPVAMRRRNGKKASKKDDTPRQGSDGKPVHEPRGGYAHDGKLDHQAMLPSLEDIAAMGAELGREYPKGQVPGVVMYARRQVVLSMMVGGAAAYEIVRVCQTRYAMSETMTRYLVREIRIAWRRDLEDQSQYARAEAINRLRSDLMRMRTTTPRPWQDILRHEKLLCAIEGTEAPKKLELTVPSDGETVRNSLEAIVSSMSDEEMLEIVTEGYEVASGRRLPSAAE